MATNPDFNDLLSALNEAGAEFLVVGAHAVMAYTFPRYTKDLDLWIRPSRANARRVRKALAVFGAPLADLKDEDLAVAGTIFQIGVAPNRIDILTSVEALEFSSCFERAKVASYGQIPIRILGKADLIANKRAVGRMQDLLDVQNLEGDGLAEAGASRVVPPKQRARKAGKPKR